MKRFCSSFLFVALLISSTTGFSPNRPAVLPADLVGKVLQVDRKWQFAVLSVGSDKGVMSQAEMLIDRGGRLVAKVKIRRVEKDSCIADVLPGWKLGEVLEGDEAIPAHPAES